MTGGPPPRPGRIEARDGARPHTAFGRDDDASLTEAVVVHTADGHAWDGLLWLPRRMLPERADTALLLVHGSMGNYLGGVTRRLAFDLAHAGFPVLACNTRMAGFGVVYGGGLIHQTPLDLDAALALLRARGFRRVVGVGHSMGATMVTNWQALRRAPEVVGLCTVAHPYSLRRSLAERWARYGSDPSFAEMERAARAALGDDPAAARDDVVLVRRGAGPTEAATDCEMWTHRTWWDCRGPGQAHAVSAERIGAVGVPVALIQAGADPVLPAGDGHALARRAREAGVPVHLDHVEGADHVFWGRVPEVAERAARWIDALPRDGAPPAPRRHLVRGTGVRPLTVAAADGVEHDALLHVDWGAAEERARASGRRTAVVHLHGNQGNMTVGALRFLPEPLAAAGFPLLSVTTRIGNVSQLFGEAVFEDALLDVAAAVGCLADHGFDHVVVSGYSLGAVLAVRAAAGPLPLPLRGLVTLGCAWSLPESTRARMAAGGATPAYADLARDLAWAGSDPGRADEALVIRRLYGPRDEPRFCGVYTARTWWHSRGPEAVDAMSHRHIGACPAPVLLVQGDGDVIVDPPDAARLAEAARAAGNPDVTVAMIPGTGHPFQGAHEQVVGAVGGWLATRA